MKRGRPTRQESTSPNSQHGRTRTSCTPNSHLWPDTIVCLNKGQCLQHPTYCEVDIADRDVFPPLQVPLQRSRHAQDLEKVCEDLVLRVGQVRDDGPVIVLQDLLAHRGDRLAVDGYRPPQIRQGPPSRLGGSHQLLFFEIPPS